MSAIKKITREKLLDAAFKIVRKEGMPALNMRSLAEKCKCSTQPIYSEFGNAQNLKNAVAQEVATFFGKFVDTEIAKNKELPYKAVGMSYIKFAVEERNLFKLLCMDGGWDRSGWGKQSYDYSVHIIMRDFGLSEKDAIRLHAEMWIFVHGIATMMATDYQSWDWDTISLFLNDACIGIARQIIGEKNGTGNKNDN